MVSHHPAMLGGYRYYGSRDMMFLVVRGQDSICPRFNLPLLFILTLMAWDVLTHEISVRRH